MGGTWAAAMGDTWDGTGVVLGGPAAQAWVAEVVDQVADLLWAAEDADQGALVDRPWAVEDADQGAVVDQLWAVEAVVAGRVEALAEQEVAEPGPEVEAGALEVAAVVGALEVEVLEEAVVAAVAVSLPHAPET